MRFYKTFIRKHGDVYQAALVEARTNDIMANNTPNLELIIRKDNFVSHVAALSWVMDKKREFEEQSTESGWQEVI